MRLACRAACIAALLMAAQPWPALAQDGAAPPAGMPVEAGSAVPPAGDDAGSAAIPASPPAEAPAGDPEAPTGETEGALAADLSAVGDDVGTEAGDMAAPPALPEPGGTVVSAGGGAGAVPGSPVLTINEAALYAGSAWGRRVQADLERLSRELAAENDRIYDELAAQEEGLTRLRATLPPAEFRERAEAFDAHAQSVRAERQAVLRNLNDLADAERQNFFSVSVPVFAQVMAERGAMVILDQRMVFISADAVDVTGTLIARIDAEIGAGPVASPDGEAPRMPNPGKGPAEAPDTAAPSGPAPSEAAPPEAAPNP